MTQLIQLPDKTEVFNEQLAIVLVEHKILGWIFKPYILRKSEQKDFFEPKEYVDGDIENENLIDDFIKIVNITSRYEERFLVKMFSKKDIPPKEFFEKSTEDYIEKHIKPYVNKRILECINVLENENLTIYIQRERSNLYNEDIIKISKSQTNTIFNFEKHSAGLNYHLSVNINGKETSLLNKKYILLSNSPCKIIINNILYSFDDIDGKKLIPFFNKEYIAVPQKLEPQYYKTFILNAIKNNHVQLKGITLKVYNEKPTVVLSIENNLMLEPRFLIRFYYHDKKFTINTKIQSITELLEEKNNFYYKKICRDIEAEKQIVEIFLDSELELENNELFRINSNIQDINQYYFWIKKYETILTKYNITVENKDGNVSKSKSDIKFEIKKHNDWFDVEAHITFGEFKIPFRIIRKYILNKETLLKLPNGEYAVIPSEWFSEYHNLMLMLKEENGKFILSKNHFIALDSVKPEACSDIDDIKKQFDFDSYQIHEPHNINATLRSYQLQGYNWLMFLRQNNFGGCLADDMGLGKTLQTLCLLSEAANDNNIEVRKDEKKINNIPQQLNLFDIPTEVISQTGKSPSIIVLPSSLVHNWYNEVKKFTPHLKVLQHIGNNRKKTNSEFYNFDIILTTYGVIRNDIEIFNGFIFNYIVLDESQIIKNSQSKIYKSVLKLESKHKLVLTGTPIENSLKDLWSQFNFINNGLLGNQKYFSDYFIKEIENGNQEVMEQLRKLTKPFILRRLKTQVAKDLPDLTEQVIYCTMSDKQASYYEEEKSKIRNLIYETIERDEIQKSSIHILQAITKLRQIANHPLLINNDIKESGKYEEICMHIENIVNENHKVLIFSSFVEHLNLVGNFLKKQHIDYSLLTGESRNREKIIDEFQQDDNKKVFLISIKAGGVGLNLTQADYVMILDPWWNPAVENQAISRAHRIGQKNKVFVYRFITENTIEEKIKLLQDQKSDLANAFIQTDKIDFDISLFKYLFD